MLSRGRAGQGWGLFSRLGQLFGLGPLPEDAAEELSALRVSVAGLAQAQADHQGGVAALREAVEGLGKQVSRAGREQFKANATAEAQQQAFQAALDQLREADACRERELAHLREQLTTAAAEGRMAVVERLLPVLDGLGEALAAGRRMLEDVPARRAEAHRTLSFRQRVKGAWALLKGATSLPDTLCDAERFVSSQEALAAWLEGLEFVQDRLLGVLASEGVRPMEAAGSVFDPHLHLAVEAAPSTDGAEPGRIVGEIRRGYLAGESVLRYAEVVVTR